MEAQWKIAFRFLVHSATGLLIRRPRPRTGMWSDLRQRLERLWQWSQKSRAERRAAEVRARFWAEVREGQHEAEGQSRP